MIVLAMRSEIQILCGDQHRIPGLGFSKNKSNLLETITTEMMNAIVRVNPMISGLIKMMPATLQFDIDDNVANITSTAMWSF